MMRVKKYITIIEEKDIEILGATLLTVDEARKLLVKEDRKYTINWWLRSPGKYTGSIVYIGKSGNVYESGGSPAVAQAVRPALRIKRNFHFDIGDVFEFDGRKFKVISEDLAWMTDGDLGCLQFNEDWRAPNANIYECSKVKTFVDEWFDEAIKRN